MDAQKLHERARTKGVNPIVYWLMRAWLQPFAHLYWRLSRIGREHVPAEGPVLFVCNHRSFIDPFIIGLCSRRPVYYVAKEEIFKIPFVGWLVSALGAFPVRRGAGDADMIETAKAILDRGDPVLIFPEGTRTRPGALGKPKRGVGRLALETGATVVPVAMIGTEAIRKGWRIRPHKIRVRIGAPLTFPRVETATAQLAAAVTDRIWPNVMLQWEWLGGLPPLRRAAIIGADPDLAGALARAGIDVDLGTRTPVTDVLPQRVRPVDVSELEFHRYDLVVFAVPASELPEAVDEHGPKIQRRTGVLVRSTGLVPPLGTLPSGYVAERIDSWAVGTLGGSVDSSLIVASADDAFSRQVHMALRAAKLKATRTSDVAGTELSTAASTAAALAAAAAADAGPDAQDAAARQVLAELEAFARRSGSALKNTDELVGTAVAKGNRFRREDAVEIPLLAARIHEAGVDAPVLDGLVGIIEGRVAAREWASSLDAEPPALKRAV
ncbi:MAG TPA: 1-acyl-sn-glycerol-3-phosphate acyltransferase [Solirubrobacter sp.]|nr:1-acyl-sn-glycerol-3-phosphate acyltransferase [Solirubrobacter sp.]